MKHLDWAKGILSNETCQRHLEEKLSSLIVTYFSDNDEYAIEKFIKSFSEGLGYLEKLMLIQHEIHPDNINIQISKAELLKRYQEVEKVMSTEIDRQFRNYITFLPATKCR